MASQPLKYLHENGNRSSYRHDISIKTSDGDELVEFAGDPARSDTLYVQSLDEYIRYMCLSFPDRWYSLSRQSIRDALQYMGQTPKNPGKIEHLLRTRPDLARTMISARDRYAHNVDLNRLVGVSVSTITPQERSQHIMALSSAVSNLVTKLGLHARDKGPPSYALTCARDLQSVLGDIEERCPIYNIVYKDSPALFWLSVTARHLRAIQKNPGLWNTLSNVLYFVKRPLSAVHEYCTLLDDIVKCSRVKLKEQAEEFVERATKTKKDHGVGLPDLVSIIQKTPELLLDEPEEVLYSFDMKAAENKLTHIAKTCRKWSKGSKEKRELSELKEIAEALQVLLCVFYSNIDPSEFFTKNSFQEITEGLAAAENNLDLGALLTHSDDTAESILHKAVVEVLDAVGPKDRELLDVIGYECATVLALIKDVAGVAINGIPHITAAKIGKDRLNEMLDEVKQWAKKMADRSTVQHEKTKDVTEKINDIVESLDKLNVGVLSNRYAEFVNAALKKAEDAGLQEVYKSNRDGIPAAHPFRGIIIECKTLKAFLQQGTPDEDPSAYDVATIYRKISTIKGLGYDFFDPGFFANISETTDAQKICRANLVSIENTTRAHVKQMHNESTDDDKLTKLLLPSDEHTAWSDHLKRTIYLAINLLHDNDETKSMSLKSELQTLIDFLIGLASLADGTSTIRTRCYMMRAYVFVLKGKFAHNMSPTSYNDSISGIENVVVEAGMKSFELYDAHEMFAGSDYKTTWRWSKSPRLHAAVKQQDNRPYLDLKEVYTKNSVASLPNELLKICTYVLAKAKNESKIAQRVDVLYAFTTWKNRESVKFGYETNEGKTNVKTILASSTVIAKVLTVAVHTDDVKLVMKEDVPVASVGEQKSEIAINDNTPIVVIAFCVTPMTMFVANHNAVCDIFKMGYKSLMVDHTPPMYAMSAIWMSILGRLSARTSSIFKIAGSGEVVAVIVSVLASSLATSLYRWIAIEQKRRSFLAIFWETLSASFKSQIGWMLGIKVVGTVLAAIAAGCIGTTLAPALMLFEAIRFIYSWSDWIFSWIPTIIGDRFSDAALFTTTVIFQLLDVYLVHYRNVKQMGLKYQLFSLVKWLTSWASTLRILNALIYTSVVRPYEDYKAANTYTVGMSLLHSNTKEKRDAVFSKEELDKILADQNETFVKLQEQKSKLEQEMEFLQDEFEESQSESEKQLDLEDNVTPNPNITEDELIEMEAKMEGQETEMLWQDACERFEEAESNKMCKIDDFFDCSDDMTCAHPTPKVFAPPTAAPAPAPDFISLPDMEKDDQAPPSSLPSSAPTPAPTVIPDAPAKAPAAFDYKEDYEEKHEQLESLLDEFRTESNAKTAEVTQKILRHEQNMERISQTHQTFVSTQNRYYMATNAAKALLKMADSVEAGLPVGEVAASATENVMKIGKLATDPTAQFEGALESINSWRGVGQTASGIPGNVASWARGMVGLNTTLDAVVGTDKTTSVAASAAKYLAVGATLSYTNPELMNILGGKTPLQVQSGNLGQFRPSNETGASFDLAAYSIGNPDERVKMGQDGWLFSAPTVAKGQPITWAHRSEVGNGYCPVGTDKVMIVPNGNFSDVQMGCHKDGYFGIPDAKRYTTAEDFSGEVHKTLLVDARPTYHAIVTPEANSAFTRNQTLLFSQTGQENSPSFLGMYSTDPLGKDTFLAFHAPAALKDSDALEIENMLKAGVAPYDLEKLADLVKDIAQNKAVSPDALDAALNKGWDDIDASYITKWYMGDSLPKIGDAEVPWPVVFLESFITGIFMSGCEIFLQKRAKWLQGDLRSFFDTHTAAYKFRAIAFTVIKGIIAVLHYLQKVPYAKSLLLWLQTTKVARDKANLLYYGIKAVELVGRTNLENAANLLLTEMTNAGMRDDYKRVFGLNVDIDRNTQMQETRDFTREYVTKRLPTVLRNIFLNDEERMAQIHANIRSIRGLIENLMATVEKDEETLQILEEESTDVELVVLESTSILTQVIDAALTYALDDVSVLKEYIEQIVMIIDNAISDVNEFK